MRAHSTDESRFTALFDIDYSTIVDVRLTMSDLVLLRVLQRRSSLCL